MAGAELLAPIQVTKAGATIMAAAAEAGDVLVRQLTQAAAQEVQPRALALFLVGILVALEQYLLRALAVRVATVETFLPVPITAKAAMAEDGGLLEPQGMGINLATPPPALTEVAVAAEQYQAMVISHGLHLEPDLGEFHEH